MSSFWSHDFTSELFKHFNILKELKSQIYWNSTRRNRSNSNGLVAVRWGCSSVGGLSPCVCCWASARLCLCPEAAESLRWLWVWVAAEPAAWPEPSAWPCCVFPSGGRGLASPPRSRSGSGSAQRGRGRGGFYQTQTNPLKYHVHECVMDKQTSAGRRPGKNKDLNARLLCHLQSEQEEEDEEEEGEEEEQLAEEEKWRLWSSPLLWVLVFFLSEVVSFLWSLGVSEEWGILGFWIQILLLWDALHKEASTWVTETQWDLKHWSVRVRVRVRVRVCVCVCVCVRVSVCVCVCVCVYLS